MKKNFILKALPITLACFVLMSQTAFAAMQIPNVISQSLEPSEIVSPNHWAKSVIKKWVASGAVKWYENGDFMPDKAITRAEFTSLVNYIFQYANSSATAVNFNDVKSDDWFALDVSKSVTAGFISGYDDGTFRPNENITRQEVARIISDALDLHAIENKSIINAFSDSNEFPDWSRSYISCCAESGYLSGYTDKSFAPTREMTRAEAISLLDRVAADRINNEQIIELTGWIIDRDCLGVDAIKHKKTCNLMGSCYASGLGIYKFNGEDKLQTNANEYIAFDAESKEKAKAFLESLPENWTSNITVKVTGKLVNNIPANADETNVPETVSSAIDHELMGLKLLTIESYFIFEVSTNIIEPN